MNTITFIEGVPGVGKTTFLNRLLDANGGAACRHIYSGMLVPENLVRAEIKKGRTLTLATARAIYLSRPYSEYLRLHEQCVSHFCKENAGAGVDFATDGSLFQAPLYDLMGLYQLSPEDMASHIQWMIDLFEASFEVRLVYIQTDDPARCVREAMENQPHERAQWIKGFCRWLEAAPYPMERGYSGVAGIGRFVMDRHEMDCQLLDRLRITKDVFARRIK